MKKIFLVALLLIASSVSAFDAPTLTASDTCSPRLLSVIPSGNEWVRIGSVTVSGTGTYNVGAKLWNPQLGVNVQFPVVIQFRVAQAEGIEQPYTLTVIEADVPLAIQNLPLNDKYVVELYAKQNCGHPLTVQAFLWLAIP